MPADGKSESAKPSEKKGFDRIFLSYAREDDEPFVRRLHADLTTAGFSIWFDRVSMPSRSLTFHQEIRDAIVERDRLILVVGPKAITSDYVTQEWQFAYYAANKCVNPIVRLNGRDSQGNNVDGYALIPEDLKLLHAEDFQRDADYDEHLKNLIRQLAEPLPPVGKLVAVPELPPGYRAQPERLKALRDLLLLDLQKPVVVTGAAARVGLQGMGGIGKSVLANALAHHPQVQRAFQDGIYWVTVGQQPRVEELQRQLAVALGGEGQFNNRHEGKEQLRQLLADRAALLILDDVWERDHADAFNVAGSRSRILLTTRDAGLVTALAARENHYRVELPTLAEAQAILGAAADVPSDQLPSEADAIIKECDRLPLALALCGGMVHGGSSWSNVLAALEEHDLEFLSSEHPDEAQHQNAWKAMDISLRVLPAHEQQRFAELAVFGADSGTPDAAVATLWQHTGGLSPRQTEALLAKFIRRSLVQRPSAADGKVTARVDLHDLLRHFATGMAIKQFGSVKTLNQRLLDAYRAKCPDGLPSGPNDGYFFENLVHHIAEAEVWPEAGDLVTSFSWLMRKCELGLVDSISEDYGILRDLAPAEAKQRLAIWSDFFRERAHILRRGNNEWPAHKILLQLAVEHANDSPVTIAAEKWLAENRCDWLWWLRVPRMARAQKNPCLAVLEGHATGIEGALALAHGRILSWAGNTLRVWDAQSGQCFAVLEGHSDWIPEALVLADGKILSWSRDKTLRLWDAQNGQCVAVLKGHSNWIRGSLVLADGKILSWSEDQTLRVWDGRSGQCIAVLEGHSYSVRGALALANGKILSWSEDKTLRVWDGRSGQCIAVLEGHSYSVRGALALANGKTLSWSRDNTLRLWEAQTSQCIAVLEGHSCPVLGSLALAYNRILSWSEDKTLRLWDAQDGKCIAVLKGHSDSVLSALALARGRILSWAGNTLRVWDAQSGQCFAVLEGHSDWIRGALALVNGGVLSWSEDKTLRVWDVQSRQCIAVLKGHSERIIDALALDDGKILSWAGDGTSDSNDKTLRLWDGRSGQCLAILEGHSERIIGALALDDGKILSWSRDNTLRLWDAQTGQRPSALEGHSESVESALPVASGRVLSWSYDNILRLWDAQSGQCLAVLTGHSTRVWGALALANDRILSWSYDETLRLWDAKSGQCLAVLTGHSKSVYGALMMADGKILSWSEDKTLRLWDTQSSQCLAVLEGHSGSVESALEVACGRVLSWSEDETLRLWEAKSGQCLATLKGHSGWIRGALVLANDRILSWSYDKTLRLWDANSGRCLAVFEGHSWWVMGALALADSRILSWSRDGTLRLWDAQSSQCLAVLERDYHWIGDALALSDGRILSWSDHEILQLWDVQSAQCLETISENQARESHPEWLHARKKSLNSKGVCGDYFIDTSSRSAFLRHKRIPNLLATWNGDSKASSRILWSDGTAVVTQANGQVCILKLYHGNRRVCLTKVEEMLSSQRKPAK